MAACHECDGETGVYGSESINYDQGYMDSICKSFQVSCWPPDFLGTHNWCSVSDAIDIIRNIGLARPRKLVCEHTIGSNKDEVTAEDLKDFTDDVAALCGGICLRCAKEGKLDLTPDCEDGEHRQPVFG